MSRSATLFAGVFSSRVITDELLSRGSSRLVEARRIMASPAFAGTRSTPAAATILPRARDSREPRPIARKSAFATTRTPLTLTAHGNGLAPLDDPWTFTYANGTFSAGSPAIVRSAVRANRTARSPATVR